MLQNESQLTSAVNKDELDKGKLRPALKSAIGSKLSGGLKQRPANSLSAKDKTSNNKPAAVAQEKNIVNEQAEPTMKQSSEVAKTPSAIETAVQEKIMKAAAPAQPVEQATPVKTETKPEQIQQATPIIETPAAKTAEVTKTAEATPAEKAPAKAQVASKAKATPEAGTDAEAPVAETDVLVVEATASAEANNDDNPGKESGKDSDASADKTAPEAADKKAGADKPEAAAAEKGGGGSRLTEVPCKEFDGKADEFVKEMDSSKGQVAADIEQTSQASVAQMQEGIGELSVNERFKKPAGAKTEEAQNAVQETSNDKQAEQHSAKVESMHKVPAPVVKKDDVKQKLTAGIQEMNKKVKTTEDVENLKKGGGNSIKNMVSAAVKGQTGAVKATYSKMESPKQSVGVKKAGSISAPDAAKTTKDLKLGQGVISEVKPEHLEFIKKSEVEADNVLAKEGLDKPEVKSLLKGITKGDLGELNKAHKGIKETSTKGTAEVNNEVAATKKDVADKMGAEEKKERQTMRQLHTTHLGHASKNQSKLKEDVEKQKAAASKHMTDIYDKANNEVKNKLNYLEIKAIVTFTIKQNEASAKLERNIEKRIDAYKDKRYSGVEGAYQWIKDIPKDFNELPGVPEIFTSERDAFVDSLDQAINNILAENQKVIEECKQIIAKAKEDIKKYASTLKGDVKKAAMGTLGDINKKFEELDKAVNARAEALKAKLATMREEAIKKVDKKIEDLKAKNAGFLTKLANFAADALLKLFYWACEQLGIDPKSIMDVVNKGKKAVSALAADPAAFFNNFGAGVGGGITSFGENIGTHLKKGLINWLTGTMGDTVEIPEKFDFMGVLKMTLSVLGLTYNNIRTSLVKHVGEKVVSAAETGFDIMKKVVTEGPMAMWEEIKGMVGNLQETVLEEIKNWAITEIVKKAIIKLMLMLNPAGALLQAVELLWKAIMFFKDNIQRIMAFVNSVFDSVNNIAIGNIGGVISTVEGAMSNILTMLISFLARYIGLDGIADKVKEIIAKVRELINKGLDKAIGFLAGKVKGWAAGEKKDEKKGEKKGEKKEAAAKVAKPETETAETGKDPLIEKLHAHEEKVNVDGGHRLTFEGKDKLVVHSETTELEKLLKQKEDEFKENKKKVKNDAKKIEDYNYKIKKVADIKSNTKEFEAKLSEYRLKSNEDKKKGKKDARNPDGEYQILTKLMAEIAMDLKEIGIVNRDLKEKDSLEFKVGKYQALRTEAKKVNAENAENSVDERLDSHHVGQKALMKKKVSNYDEDDAPAILVSYKGHTTNNDEGIVTRSMDNELSAYGVVDRDIKELYRVYKKIPTTAPNNLIAVNKRYPIFKEQESKSIKTEEKWKEELEKKKKEEEKEKI